MKKILSVIAGLLIFALIGAGLIGRNIMFKLNYKKEIQKYAKEYKVDSKLLAAVINFEDGFNAETQYKKGEPVGPFQFRDTKVEKYAKEMGLKDFKKEDIAKVDVNIKMGAWYIKENFKNNDYNELAVAWMERNNNQEKRMQDYYRQYYGERIEKRVKLYKIFHPEL